jgi:ABC-type branched-subunit amino acid transport system permease subunit
VISWLAVRRSLGVIFTGVLTLALSFALQDLLFGQQGLTGGSTGQQLTAAAVSLADNQIGGYYLFAAVLIGFLIVYRLLQISHFGWAFRALRDDEEAAELAGVNVARYRIYAAVIGSAMIGLTGALYAYSEGFISPPRLPLTRLTSPCWCWCCSEVLALCWVRCSAPWSLPSLITPWSTAASCAS